MPSPKSADQVVRLARGCRIPAYLIDDFAARCAYVLATSAPDSMIASASAARLHGLWLPDDVDEIHVATASPGHRSRAMTRTQRPELSAHRRQLDDADRVLVDGLAVTSIARTWVDLAVDLGVADLVAAGDSALRAGTTAGQLADAITRSRRMRGVRKARAALPLLDAASRSRPESHLRVAASAPDIPSFQVNVPVFRDVGGWLAEPDLSLVAAKIALEYLGADHADPKRMRRDITRSTDLRREGWVCLEFGPAEVLGRPWEIAPEIRALIRARNPSLLR